MQHLETERMEMEEGAIALRSWSGLFHDVRYGFRQFRRKPGFAAVAIATLALGIGANTAVFSVVNAILLQPLPFPRPTELVRLNAVKGRGGVNRTGASYAEFTDWRDEAHAFKDMAAYHGSFFTLTGDGHPELLSGLAATPSLFSILGAKPIVGRNMDWNDENPGSEPVALVGENLWRHRFGGKSDIIGKTIKLNDKAFTVIGVLPAGFQFPFGLKPPEVWVPVVQDPTFGVLAKLRDAHYLDVIARLRARTTVDQADTQMNTVLSRLTSSYPKSDAGWSVRIVRLKSDLVKGVKSPLLVALGAVVLVLLIACVNVANLLLARSTSRTKEMSIRAALGATRGRLARQLLTESVLLGVLGGLLGLLLAILCIPMVGSAIPPTVSRIRHIQIDGWVMLFTLGTSIIVGTLPGLTSAFPGRSDNLDEALKEAGRSSNESSRHNRMRSALVISEIALTLTLLTGAGLLVRTLVAVEQVKPGFNPSHLLEVHLTLPREQYRKPGQWAEFYSDLLNRLRDLPGVTAVGATLAPPLTGANLEMRFQVLGRAPLARGELQSADYAAVSPGYFHTLQVPLLRGRFFTESDNASALPVVIIDRTFAKDYLNGENPIGDRITIEYPGLNAQSREIIGVVGDMRSRGLGEAPPPAIFTPYTQTPWWVMAILIRASSKPAALIAPVRSDVQQIDPNLPLGKTGAVEQDVRRSTAKPRLYAALLGSLAGLALVLAVVGIYGVMSYSVSQRTHEFGVRIALGARRGDMLRLVVGQGLRLTLVGMVIGIVAALALTRFLGSFLYGVTPADPLTIAAVSLLLTVVALLATYVPARRAMKVDPIVALRYE